ncbi:LytTR family DNA-binding domain-containing protein [Aureisphaera galaxeae]|uniref:LytR/AlgR family response regulator transcription factor n=1 Tax=Aureisphaera galaxeae TaxID=1538023 RepID=UPI00234FCD51|nr:LytTR family DNA-binding domain-containing protein [Aureisphaera galaxeae]MDC8005964.1 LytTR family DNA-binding domain-containing protein [Aureisphaera galaxeae]
MHILILEDEIPAFEKLRTYLSVCLQGELTYDWGRSKEETKFFLTTGDAYDLIFADIQLLDGNSFEVFQDCTPEAPIVFCTAFDSYLLEAFKTNGIAYVLKPYGQEEIDQAIAKYRRLFAPNTTPQLSPELFQHLKKTLVRKAQQYKQQFVIKTPKGINILPANKVALIEAAGDFCKLKDDEGRTYLFSESIGSIYEKLDPEQFFRINRSQIVQMGHIIKMEAHFKNRLLISLRGIKERVTTSSRTTADFRKWLDR